MNTASLQSLVLSSLSNAKKPLGPEDVRTIAMKALNDAGAGKEAGDFNKWFDTNGTWLTAKVNRV